ncbi:MAG TPA: molybdopterin-dependent oxidoreductase [Limnochordia bacterium]
MSAWWRGVLAAICLTVVEVVGRFTLGTPLVPEWMAQQLFAWVPIGLFEFFVTRLGTAAKWLAFAGMITLHWAIGGLLGWAMGRFHPPGTSRIARYAGWSLVLTLLWLCVFWPLVRIHPLGPAALGPSAVPAWLAFFAYAILFTLAYAALEMPPRSAAPLAAGGVERRPSLSAGRSADLGRRRFLFSAGSALLIAALWSWRGVAKAAADIDAIVRRILGGMRGVAPEITPTSAFYKVSKNLFDPRVPVETWRLHIDGEVEHPAALSYDELTALGSVKLHTTMCCISNWVGGDLIGTALWEGIPLAELLRRAGLKEGVLDVRLEAYDGYADSIPLRKALDPATLVVWKMNDEPLPWDHGAPVRLIVPGIYGMKSVKWLTRITPVAHDFLGYWETRGWSDSAVVKTLSRIDVPSDGAVVGPAPIDVAGIAFGGDRGISKVEVSFDDGATWRPAALTEPLSPYTWVHWFYRWRPAKPGRYSIAVRAYDGLGVMQTGSMVPPAPDGASGWHRIRVTYRG